MIELKSHITNCLLWKAGRAKAQFKQQPSDFIVDEILDWDFRGLGEHLFLRVEKTYCNTVWVAKQLAKFYDVPPRDIGYSGLKDRHAITTQYFSIRLPGIKPNHYKVPTHDEFRIISHTLHDKKLKRGNHKYNDFCIRLTSVKGDTDQIEKRLRYLQTHGSPNFFDSQRFGNNSSNLERVIQWLNGEIDVRKRNEKSLLLSSLRAAIFNQQLSERVQNNTWYMITPGDIIVLDGTHSHFHAESEHGAIASNLIDRATAQDIHPAGILIGADSSWCEAYPALSTLLQRERLTSSYRPLRINIRNLSWQFNADTLTINLRLPSGAYASGVIKQIFDID